MATSAKEIVLDQIETVSYLMNRDIDATPSELGEKCFGGCARNAKTFIAESAGFNFGIAECLKTGEFKMKSEEEQKAFYDSVGSIKEAQGMLNQSFDALKDTVSGLSEDQLDEKVMAPWGQEMTKVALAMWGPSHAFYHDGQLTYIQTLNNDGEMHWMPDEEN